MLISPLFNAQACQELYLEFSNQFNYYSGSNDEIADVDLSTDGGMNWDNKLRIQGGDDGYPSPVTKSVNLVTLFGQDLSTLRVRFHYYQASYEWWWAIDNVEVVGAFND